MAFFSSRILKTLAAAALAVALPATGALAAGDSKAPRMQDWSFAGIFGTYDTAQLQRGFQVYTENCSACHALSRIAFRNLMEPGGPEFSEAEVRAIAVNYFVTDGPDSFGEMFEREARLSDRFPPPFPNREAAVAAMGAYPPDFSLLAKARAPTRGFPGFVIDIFTGYAENGPDYIYSLLTGYEDPPADEEAPIGLNYNPYFIGGEWIAMAPPLFEGMHAYGDGSPETISQYAQDVAAFMMWAAEPHLNARKEMGFRVLAFLVIFGGLVYMTKRRVWSAVDH
ncbi:cytochrome c1 [Ahrensia marina]|uniref:cytochrome c1 n=1 Tax=Ahrensia marina TaxID=1514904 RepID=UPI0035CFED33